MRPLQQLHLTCLYEVGLGRKFHQSTEKSPSIRTSLIPTPLKKSQVIHHPPSLSPQQKTTNTEDHHCSQKIHHCSPKFTTDCRGSTTAHLKITAAKRDHHRSQEITTDHQKITTAQVTQGRPRSLQIPPAYHAICPKREEHQRRRKRPARTLRPPQDPLRVLGSIHRLW